MRMFMKKLLSGLLALTLLLTLAPGALAAETLLQVNLNGLYAMMDGNYQSVAASGAFDVYQNEQLIGTVQVTPGGENTIALPAGGDVRLAPVLAQIPAELPLSAYGYGVAVAEGRLNIAPVTVYANAGLFTVEAGVQSSFALLDAEGETALSFETDAAGLYAPELAIPAGLYTLRMTATAGVMWPELPVEITTYTGEDSILKITVPAGLATATPVPTEAPTAEPTFTPEPTEAPTAEPTFTPEPTEAPTAEPTFTPEPTEAPTAEPTATPIPTEGGLILSVEGTRKAISYSIFNGQSVIAEGQLSYDASQTLPNLQQGEYLVSMTLPDDVTMVSLNGHETYQRGVVLWRAEVTAMQDNLYVMGFSGTGGMMFETENTEVYQAVVNGPEMREITRNENGEYEAANLLPGRYGVTLSLPAGDYEYDAKRWRLDQNADGTYTAIATVDIMENSLAVLPTLIRRMNGTVSGTLLDMDGTALRGAAVTLYGADGQIVAATETDAMGAWQVTDLPYGEYVAQCAAEGRAIPAASFTLSVEKLSAQLMAVATTPAKITVRAFVDDNNNGSSGKGEGFLPNVEVSLVDANGLVAATDLTNSDGYATLAAAAGSYTLRVTAPADYGFGVQGNGKLAYTQSIMQESPDRTQDSAPLTLNTDEKLTAGVGLLPMGIVRGTVWNDLNADGVWQPDEPGIPGIRMSMHGGRGDRLIETVTDENGVYEFRQVMKGTHTVQCYVPDDHVFTGKAKGAVETRSRMTTEADRIGEEQIKIERGQVIEGFNIGMMKGLIIEGMCFQDENHNGVYDEGEKPLPGVEMRLARQSNNVMLQTVTSDENGRYHFVGQRGSTFTIRAIIPKGWVFTQAAEGENGNRFPPDGNKNDRRITDITIENGGYAWINMGAITYGDISGRVYFDKDFSGAWESGEPVGQEYHVTLLNEAGEKVASAKTDKNGMYAFTNMGPGTYYLTMTPAEGYAFTTLGSGNVMQTLPDGTGKSRALKLEMGSDITGAGIGMIVPAVVSGTVFADYNENGLRDAGEAGLAGTAVRLMNEAGEAYAATVTESGEFLFNAVMPGSYYLQYALPERGLFSAVIPGGNTVTGENGVGSSEWFTVSVGGSYAAPLCGGLVLSDISGAIFEDVNGNGVWDEDEGAVNGALVSLIPMRGDLPSHTIVTGGDGSFAMYNLRPDNYILTLTCPGEYVVSRLVGVDMPIKSGLANQTVSFQLGMGTQWHAQRIGCVIPASWTGEAWLDENCDGLRAADEAPAAGETLELRDANTGETVITVQTDENGVFNMTGIAPGEYELVYPLGEGNLLPAEGNCDFTQQGIVMTTGRLTIRQRDALSGTTLCVVRTTEISGKVVFEEYSGLIPIAGAVLHLRDASGSTLAEVVTAEDGAYAFKGLMPADYTLDVTIPAGYVLVESSDTHLAERGLSTFVLEANGQYGVSDAIHLKMAKHLKNMDVIMVLPGRLGDKAWLDLNGNGLQDGEEGGIPGIAIELMRGDRVVASTVTDQYGYYVFENLYPTEYTLRVTWPAEVVPTQLRTDVHQISSVLQADGLSIPVTVVSNKANYAADLGFVLVEEGKYPAGYGEGEKQNWKR